MRIEFKTVDPAAMRYPTAGDWEWLPDGALKLTVPDYGTSDQSALLVLIHELVEAFLCKRDGVSEESVTKFDVENPTLEEPGDDPSAPYHHQHQIAMALEASLAAAMQVNWDKHNQWVVSAGNEVERIEKSGNLQKSRITMEGPRWWAELHLVALRQEGFWTPYLKPWFDSWFASLPFDGCPCREHAEKWIAENPVDYGRFFEWSIRFHNSVNERNMKPTLSIEQARALWQSRLY